jgi:hypothetical protein
MMISASAEYDVPSAGDEAIFGEILRSLGRDAGPVTAVLQMRDAKARSPISTRNGEMPLLPGCARPAAAPWRT